MVYAPAAGVTCSLLVQRKVTKRNTPQAARPFGVRNRSGIFGRHIHVPAENDAHPVRRPWGVLPFRLPRLNGAPKIKSQSNSNSNSNSNSKRANASPSLLFSLSLLLLAFGIPF
jgi:hypothetical protein